MGGVTAGTAGYMLAKVDLVARGWTCCDMLYPHAPGCVSCSETNESVWDGAVGPAAPKRSRAKILLGRARDKLKKKTTP